MDNVVNMDTRTVISAINYGNFNSPQVLHNDIPSLSAEKSDQIFSLLNDDKPLRNIENILSWMTNLKSKYELSVERIPLNAVQDWIFDGNTMSNERGKYFKVIGTHVQIDNREVTCWDQPMIQPAQEGLIGFIIKKINGTYHFLV